VTYRAQREFRTEDPARLRSDLQRQGSELELAFSSVERESETRPKPVKVPGATYQAKHGELVLAGYNQDARVLLPPSTSETAGRSVCVVQVGGAGFVSIVASPGQTVNGAASTTIGFSTGYRRYIDDGMGGFWGPAA
jgi:hypothetical protein